MKPIEINKNLVPMFIGFNGAAVEYVAETLGNSIQESYELIGTFRDYGLLEGEGYE